MAHGRKRRISIQAANSANSDINITPLVDVVLVLLIIFMVVTPLLEKDIAVRVPESEQVEVQQDVPPEQLVVSVDKEGTFSINSEKIADTEYVARLTRVLAAKSKGDRLVFFTADDNTNYAKLVAALDGARQAGAETLGMMTDKIDQPKTAPATP
jgi:biopolymer transport protein ExbD